MGCKIKSSHLHCAVASIDDEEHSNEPDAKLTGSFPLQSIDSHPAQGSKVYFSWRRVEANHNSKTGTA